MKKRLLTLFGILALSGAAFSQTWNFSNEPAIDANAMMYLVDTTSANLANQSGANQTWNFSMLGGYVDNSRTVSVVQLEDDLTFPNATHMLMIPGFMNTAYVYEEGTNDKLAHGYQFELPDFGVVIFQFSDFQKMLQFPLALSTTFTDFMSGTFTIFDEPNDAEGQTWVTADGTGTLILANNVSHTDVMRIHTVDTMYADVILSAFPIPTSVTIVRETFDYLKSDVSNFPLFTHATLKVLNPIIGEIKVSVVLSSENPTEIVGVNNLELNQTVVYPNPNAGHFTVNLGNVDEASVQVVDISGRVVYKSVSSGNQVQIDLSQELPGLYFVNIVRNGITTVEKVMIK
jgi:hypothetical protein